MYGKKGRSLFWTSISHVLRDSTGIFWGFPLGGEGILALPIDDLGKDEEFPKWRLVLSNRTLVLWPIVSQSLLKDAQILYQIPIQWDMKSHMLHYLNSKQESREFPHQKIHMSWSSKWISCRQVNFCLSPHMNVVKKVLMTEWNLGPWWPQYIWGGQCSIVNDWQWEKRV